jgi:spore coat protein JB
MRRCCNHSDQRCRLLEDIYEVSFAIDDILLFLDTHPRNEKALAYYKEMITRRKQYMMEYAKNYGPLTIDDAIESGTGAWKWMEQPFPWEKEGACR